jgi:hypothetical protein
VNGYERHVKDHGRLHPKIVAELQPFFPSIFRVAQVRVNFYEKAWWDLFHKTGIWTLAGQVIVGSRFSWNVSNRTVLSIIAHELFHVWQWQRDGAGSVLLGSISSLVRKYTGRHWHSSRIEREAIEFQDSFLRKYQGQLPEDVD